MGAQARERIRVAIVEDDPIMRGMIEAAVARSVLFSPPRPTIFARAEALV